ncbi:hypothetical protein VNO77_09160 [Canavalia gladiata]|uniref:Uncharacterized protein n=1 Tax=Canavalia gladiata TaxID=3824 RepID=A0AAN9M9S3_CANGL
MITGAGCRTTAVPRQILLHSASHGFSVESKYDFTYFSTILWFRYNRDSLVSKAISSFTLMLHQSIYSLARKGTTPDEIYWPETSQIWITTHRLLEIYDRDISIENITRARQSSCRRKSAVDGVRQSDELQSSWKFLAQVIQNLERQSAFLFFPLEPPNPQKRKKDPSKLLPLIYLYASP